MVKMRLVMALAVTTTGLVACGGDSGGAARTVTVTTTQTSAQAAPVEGDAILIETRVNAKLHTGDVLSSSGIGESAFCRGGKTSGGSDGPTITTTFGCSKGTLTIQYAPIQRSFVQGAVWGIVRGTGSYEGLRGGGSMVAKFTDEEPDVGREIFTGIVRK